MRNESLALNAYALRDLQMIRMDHSDGCRDFRCIIEAVSINVASRMLRYGVIGSIDHAVEVSLNR
jgi:hypothetical protein